MSLTRFETKNGVELVINEVGESFALARTSKRLVFVINLLAKFQEVKSTLEEVEAGINKDLCLRHWLRQLDEELELDGGVFYEILTPIQERIDEIEKEIVRQQKELSDVGTVYLIGSRQANLLKIGYTKNLEQRLANLQSKSVHRLEIIKTKLGTLEDEKDALKKAYRFKLRGEWFNWDDSIVEDF